MEEQPFNDADHRLTDAELRSSRAGQIVGRVKTKPHNIQGQAQLGKDKPLTDP
jgi:hypothetical protein